MFRLQFSGRKEPKSEISLQVTESSFAGLSSNSVNKVEAWLFLKRSKESNPRTEGTLSSSASLPFPPWQVVLEHKNKKGKVTGSKPGWNRGAFLIDGTPNVGSNGTIDAKQGPKMANQCSKISQSRV